MRPSSGRSANSGAMQKAQRAIADRPIVPRRKKTASNQGQLRALYTGLFGGTTTIYRKPGSR